VRGPKFTVTTIPDTVAARPDLVTLQFAAVRPNQTVGRRRRGPWKKLEDVEFATLEWVAWYNGSRLLEPLRYVPPAELETAYHDRQAAPVGMAVLT